MNRKIKTLLIVGLCLVIVSSCVVIAIVFSGSRKYDTVGNDSQRIDSSENVISSVATSDLTSTNKNITITGDLAPNGLDATLFIKKAYELKYLFAISSFDNPNEISVNKLVQYAFCHMYYDSLVDMPKSENLVYRSASADEISAEITKQFNITDLNVKESDLYNSAKDNFEMWEPKYSTIVVATSTVSILSDSSYKIVANYYSDEKKAILKGAITITISKIESLYYISSML